MLKGMCSSVTDVSESSAGAGNRGWNVSSSPDAQFLTCKEG